MSDETNFIFPDGLSEDALKVSAYAAMMTLAVLPIWFGSKRSAKERQEEEQQPEILTKQDAYMFPFIASGVLFSLYLVFNYVPEEYISTIVTGYFFLIGVLALVNTIRPTFVPFFPAWFTESPFEFKLTQKVVREVKDDEDEEENDSEKEEEEQEEEEEEEEKPKRGAKKTKASSKKSKVKKSTERETETVTEDIFLISFDYVDFVCLAFSLVIGVWYVYTKNWIANNIFGLSFAINGIEMLSLGSIQIGCILLGGLFVYDVFWVFGTDVMVTVAKSFDAPIKLLFPKDFLINGIFGKQFTMLGLGDIVIPGIFVALLLRFDVARMAIKKGNKKETSQKYFLTGFISYIVGLLSTFVVMHVWQHAQPALLYLVPACIGGTFLVAIPSGDVGALLEYSDEDGLAEETKANSKKKK
eukprot:Nk52_evm19s288 gene=Nk52_evmTU19s288